MKKRIEDLTVNDAIHCETKEQFKRILKLNPKNTCGVNCWDLYRKDSCYRPMGYNGRGDYYDLDWFKSEGYTIHKAEDFLNNIKERLISPSEATEIIDIACSNWKNKLIDLWGKDILLKEDIIIEETYSIGDRFACSWSNYEYILARVNYKECSLISLRSGDMFCEPIKIYDIYNISEQEFEKITNNRPDEFKKIDKNT